MLQVIMPQREQDTKIKKVNNHGKISKNMPKMW